MRKPVAALLASLALVGVAGCTDPYDPGQRALGGAGIGAASGALIGGALGGGRGALAGALIGGAGGAVVGAGTTPPPPVYAPPPAYYPSPAYAPAPAYYPPGK